MVFVNEIEGAHVPMLLVRSIVAGEVSDWTAQVCWDCASTKLIDHNRQSK